MNERPAGSTQPPVRPILYPMDEETEEAWALDVISRMRDYTEAKFEWYNANFGGFFRQTPAERLAFYANTEPVFDPNIPAAILETILEQGAFEPLVEVYDEMGNVRPPIPAPMDPMAPTQLDPMTGQPMVTLVPAYLGMAPEIFGPWWRRVWAVNKEECLRHLRDYRDIQRRQGYSNGNGNGATPNGNGAY